MRGGPRRDAFDGLRTVLVMGVMIHHLQWTLGHVDPLAVAGWLPVDGFFVLSGYLIATNLLSELDSAGSIRVGRFLARRLARLYPALLVVLAAIGVVSLLVDDRSWSATWPSLASSASYLHNFTNLDGLDVFGFGSMLFEVGPLWSLSIEFQFYVALPFVFIGLAAAGLPRRAWLGIVVATGVASAAWRTSSGIDGYPRSYLFTPMRLDSLMWGVALALLARSGALARVPVTSARVVGAGATLVLLALYFTASAYEPATYRWGITVAGLASAGLVGALVRDPDSIGSRLLSLAPLAALGRRSYSAYLWHQAVFLLLLHHAGLGGWSFAVAGIALTWLLADVTYRLVERPVIVRSNRFWSERRLSARRRSSMVHYITNEPTKPMSS